MKLNNYNLDTHALAMLNNKIDEQHHEIISLRQKISELEKEMFNFSFSNFPETIPIEHQGKLLKIIATVGMHKNIINPGHHCIAEYNSKNNALRQYSYQVSDDIFNILDDTYLSSMLINMHKQLIQTILSDISHINKDKKQWASL